MNLTNIPNTLDCMVDLSHNNGQASNFHESFNAGILAYYLKATEGTGFIDPTYLQHRERVLTVTGLPGAYHFGHDGNGVGQAHFFLGVAQNQPTDRWAFDWERPKGASLPSIATLEDFVRTVSEATHRIVDLYASDSVFESVLNPYLASNPGSLLAQCHRWVASYSHPPTGEWSFWQYDDGADVTTPGLGSVDRSLFHRPTSGELRQFWSTQSGPS